MTGLLAPPSSPRVGATPTGEESSLLRVGREGRLRLRFERYQARTVLAHRAFTMPLQVFAPLRLDDPAAVVSMLNPTGGLLGGDRLSIEVAVGQDAHAYLTTPSATRIYRTAGPTAEQEVLLRVHPGGTLEWMPDHAIPSAGSAFRQQIVVDAMPGSRLIAVDAFAAGRVARGEAWAFARLEAAITVREGPRRIFHDRFALDGGGGWAATGCADGHPYFGSVVVLGIDDAGALAQAMGAALEKHGVTGAAAAGPRGGVMARVLATSAPALQAALHAMCALARWRLLGLPPLTLRKL